MSFLKKLFEKWSCSHEWVFEKDTNVETYDDFGLSGRYTRRTYICKKCGKFKQIKI